MSQSGSPNTVAEALAMAAIEAEELTKEPGYAYLEFMDLIKDIVNSNFSQQAIQKGLAHENQKVRAHVAKFLSNCAELPKEIKTIETSKRKKCPKCGNDSGFLLGWICNKCGYKRRGAITITFVISLLLSLVTFCPYPLSAMNIYILGEEWQYKHILIIALGFIIGGGFICVCGLSFFSLVATPSMIQAIKEWNASVSPSVTSPTVRTPEKKKVEPITTHITAHIETKTKGTTHPEATNYRTCLKCQHSNPKNATSCEECGAKF